jgi:hypothetical protein
VLLDAEDHLAIEKLKSKFTAAIGASDGPGLGGIFMDNAIVVAPRRGAVTGPGVRRFWRNSAQRMKNIKFAPNDMVLLGADVVRESGSMSFETADESAEPTIAEYLFIWHKVGGEWKASAMTWSRIMKNAGGAGGEKAG